ncbi:MAG: DegT/DnrJ/EryC1/StrS family aminotransferase, partial [Terriglobia bacterium]
MNQFARIGDKEKAYVLELLEGQFRGPFSVLMTSRLEKLFAEKFHVRYALSFSNGTATMHATLAAMGIGEGHEVIVPPLTMASTSLAVLHARATPVFADIDPQTWTIDPQSVEERITARTRAIVPVAIYGLPADMDRLMQIARSHHLLVLEDDAQCLLGSIDGRLAGSIADASSFSFQSSKHMTSGEGGMVTTNDPKLAARIRQFAALGYQAVGADPGGARVSKEVIQSPDYARFESIGFNYRMPELCAAVALAQLERLEELVNFRIRVAELLGEALGDCGWLIPQWIPPGFRHSYWTYVLRLQHPEVTWHNFRPKYLELGGDPMYGAWRLTYLEPAFYHQKLTPQQSQTYAEGLCPVAEALQPALLQFKTNYFDLEEASR